MAKLVVCDWCDGESMLGGEVCPQCFGEAVYHVNNPSAEANIVPCDCPLCKTTASDAAEGCSCPDGSHKWEITPNPWSGDFDVLVTDDDQEALNAIKDAAEQAWDQSEPGDKRTITIRMNAVPKGGLDHDRRKG
jgi:hypothetical protein